MQRHMWQQFENKPHMGVDGVHILLAKYFIIGKKDMLGNTITPKYHLSCCNNSKTIISVQYIHDVYIHCSLRFQRNLMSVANGLQEPCKQTAFKTIRLCTKDDGDINDKHWKTVGCSPKDIPK